MASSHHNYSCTTLLALRVPPRVFSSGFFMSEVSTRNTMALAAEVAGAVDEEEAGIEELMPLQGRNGCLSQPAAYNQS
jgi:hypothetical protein